MRNNILTLFLFLTSTLSFGQSNYISFEENIRWRIDQTNDAQVQALNCSDTYHYHLEFQGDTTILAKTYMKMFRSDVFESTYNGQSNCFPYPEYSTSGYAGAIYDDSVANIVYFIPAFSGTTEYVLYDYNLTIGDTINSAMVLCDRVVTDIDTVSIGGIDRKRWHYLSCDLEPEFYIEGLGSSHGLIEPTGFIYMYSDLICIQQNGNTIYETGVNSAFGCYGVFVEIDDLNKHYVSIYPNPASDMVIIQNLSKTELTGIELINQLGQKQAVEISFSKDQLQINTSKLVNGIYFVKLTSQGGSELGRFTVYH